MWRHIVNMLLYFLPPTRLFGLRRMLLRSAHVDMEYDASFCGKSWIFGPGRLAIGSRSWISPGCTFYTHLSAPISIGDNCDIGPEVTFITGSHEIGTGLRRAGPGLASQISIGDGCWIGARSTILGGVRIGKGCIVAAGSLVTDDVSDNSLIAGVPAKTKRLLNI